MWVPNGKNLAILYPYSMGKANEKKNPLLEDIYKNNRVDWLMIEHDHHLSAQGRLDKKKCFVSWKAYFSSCYFFITPFPLHFKDDF